MDEEENVTRDESDILKILIATDIHLGFEEKDPIRDQDTFDTFEEILKLAVSAEVDFILLGGDLFHHAKPSPYCIYKCTELLRRYCLGDRPVEIELLSDPSHNFTNSANPTVNYEDPNLNVSIPVFSIHGNHDDPTGHRHISAMDLMASSGLVNYFGRCTNYDEIEIEPILLKKGQTKLALYGLSHIKDERLGRLFVDKKVKMMAPENKNDWFHLLIWHQNRATRGVKNFIPDDSLPSFLDLVIWGHEHDCRIDAERKFNDVFVCQPGSSVATSLAEGEAIPKKVGIVRVFQRTFKITPVELKTVRPFIFRELVLKSDDEMADETNSAMTTAELTLDVVKKEVESMIEEAKTLGRVGKASELPLIRLNVKYKNERQVFNAIRFGQSYIGRIANPEDMVKCNPFKASGRRRNPENKDGDDVDSKMEIAGADRVEDIVSSYFRENQVLKLFPYNAINEAVKKFIDADNSDAPMIASEVLVKETLQKLDEDMPELADLEDYLSKFYISRETKSVQNITQVLNDPNRPKKRSAKDDSADSHQNGSNEDSVFLVNDDSDDSVIDVKPSVSTKAAKKPAKGPGSRGGRGSRSRGRGKAKDADLTFW